MLIGFGYQLQRVLLGKLRGRSCKTFVAYILSSEKGWYIRSMVAASQTSHMGWTRSLVRTNSRMPLWIIDEAFFDEPTLAQATAEQVVIPNRREGSYAACILEQGTFGTNWELISSVDVYQFLQLLYNFEVFGCSRWTTMSAASRASNQLLQKGGNAVAAAISWRSPHIPRVAWTSGMRSPGWFNE